MKKIFLSIVICFSLMHINSICKAQQNANKFILNGNLQEMNNGLMYLSYSNKDNQQVMDSAVINNGKFLFSGNINVPTLANLHLKEERRTQQNSVRFFMEPSAMTVSLIINNFSSAKFTGSKTQDEYAVLQSEKQKVEERWKVVMDTLSAVNKRSNFEYQELKNWVLQPYFKEMNEMDFIFFNSHPQSYATAYMLRFYVNKLPVDSLQMYYSRLGQKVQQSSTGKELAGEIKKIRASSPGSIAADFTATDINGNSLSLFDFKGKYVLLDFWASWCVPCRKGNPHLKELYAKYKDKGFEIIGISDDDTRPEEWRKAIEKDGIGIWKHLLRGLKRTEFGFDKSGDISKNFSIHSLPTKILIDPNGMIIGRYGGGGENDEAMDEKLKEIFAL